MPHPDDGAEIRRRAKRDARHIGLGNGEQFTGLHNSFVAPLPTRYPASHARAPHEIPPV